MGINWSGNAANLESTGDSPVIGDGNVVTENGVEAIGIGNLNINEKDTAHTKAMMDVYSDNWALSLIFLTVTMICVTVIVAITAAWCRSKSKLKSRKYAEPEAIPEWKPRPSQNNRTEEALIPLTPIKLTTKVAVCKETKKTVTEYRIREK